MIQINNKHTRKLVMRLIHAAITSVDYRMQNTRTNLRTYLMKVTNSLVITDELKAMLEKVDEYYKLKTLETDLIAAASIFRSNKQNIEDTRTKLAALECELRGLTDDLCEPSPYPTYSWKYATDLNELVEAKDTLVQAYYYSKIVGKFQFYLGHEQKKEFTAETMRIFYEDPKLPTVDSLKNALVDLHKEKLLEIERYITDRM